MKLLISVVKLRLLSGRRVYLYLLGDRSSFICLHALICISFCFFVEDSRFVSNRRVLTTHFHFLLFCLLFFCLCCRNAYLASFPYGQCMDWTTHVDQCPGEEAANATLPNLCSGYYTCGYGFLFKITLTELSLF